jgi:thiamine-monophosphate kinase
VSALGEFGLIGTLVPAFSDTADVLVGSGDDAALLVAEGSVLVSTDLMVEGRHFRRDWSSGRDVGHKVAAANLSDIAAMGGVPTLVISVTVLGRVSEGEPVLRSGARPGDVVALAGRIGWAAAGLAVLARGFRSPRVVVEAHRRPQPPYAAGPQAAAAGATAMTDVSDGLLNDLHHVALASGVAIDVDSSTLDVPEPLQAVGAALGVDPVEFCLSGGDDHALVATFAPDAPLPDGWRRIGSVQEGSGVTVDGAEHEGPGGHRHFA